MARKKKFYENIPWLPDEEYQKAEGQLRMQLSGVFMPFMMYGLQDLVPGAIEEAMSLAVDFSLRVRGINKPISLDKIRNAK